MATHENDALLGGAGLLPWVGNVLDRRTVCQARELVQPSTRLSIGGPTAPFLRFGKALYATTEARAKEILAAWMERDGTTVDEERAGLSRMVERIEFDPATGGGQITYRIPAGSGAGRFHIRGAAELGVGDRKPGNNWRPHGDSNPGYRRERVFD